MKSDGEPALIVFADSVTRGKSGQIIPEISRKGDSQSNGEVETAIQTLSAQARTMKLALDTSVGTTIDDDKPIISWLVEYSALVLRRHLVGSDGRTAYERLKGRGDRRRLVEFGECVVYKPLKSAFHQPRPLEARFEDVIFLGLSDVSGEVLVGLGAHILRGPEVRRIPENIRWERDKVLAIRATVVQPNPGQHDMRIRTHLREPLPPRPPLVAQPSEGNHDARQIYMTKADFDEGKHGAGYTDGCSRCSKMRLGLPVAGAHSAECRTHMQNTLPKLLQGKSD